MFILRSIHLFAALEAISCQTPLTLHLTTGLLLRPRRTLQDGPMRVLHLNGRIGQSRRCPSQGHQRNPRSLRRPIFPRMLKLASGICRKCAQSFEELNSQKNSWPPDCEGNDRDRLDRGNEQIRSISMGHGHSALYVLGPFCALNSFRGQVCRN